jgi:hypothetical protein
MSTPWAGDTRWEELKAEDGAWQPDDEFSNDGGTTWTKPGAILSRHPISAWVNEGSRYRARRPRSNAVVQDSPPARILPLELSEYQYQDDKQERLLLAMFFAIEYHHLREYTLVEEFKGDVPAHAMKRAREALEQFKKNEKA